MLGTNVKDANVKDAMVLYLCLAEKLGKKHE